MTQPVEQIWENAPNERPGLRRYDQSPEARQNFREDVNRRIGMAVDVTETFAAVMVNIGRVTSVPYLAESAGLVVTLIDIVIRMESNKEKLRILVWRTVTMVAIIFHEIDEKERPMSSDLQAKLISMHSQLQEILEFVVPKPTEGRLRRIIGRRAEADAIEEHERRLDQALNEFNFHDQINQTAFIKWMARQMAEADAPTEDSRLQMITTAMDNLSLDRETIEREKREIEEARKRARPEREEAERAAAGWKAHEDAESQAKRQAEDLVAHLMKVKDKHNREAAAKVEAEGRRRRAGALQSNLHLPEPNPSPNQHSWNSSSQEDYSPPPPPCDRNPFQCTPVQSPDAYLNNPYRDGDYYYPPDLRRPARQNQDYYLEERPAFSHGAREDAESQANQEAEESVEHLGKAKNKYDGEGAAKVEAERRRMDQEDWEAEQKAAPEETGRIGYTELTIRMEKERPKKKDAAENAAQDKITRLDENTSTTEPHGARNKTEAICSLQTEMRGAEPAATFLANHQPKITANIRKGLLNLGYSSDFIIQAGFNEELLDGGVEHQEIFIILQKDLTTSPDDISRVLLPYIAPFSGVVYAPSCIYLLPPTPDAAHDDGTHTPSISTLHPDGNAGTLPASRNTATSDRSSQSIVGGQSNLQIDGTLDGVQPTDGNNVENEPQVGTEDTETLEGAVPRPKRRILRLNLWSPLTIEAAGARGSPSVDHTFNLHTLIEIELSSNEDGNDYPTGVPILDPWCFLNFESLFMSSDSQQAYSLEHLHITAQITPMQTSFYGLPIVQHGVADESKRKTEHQNGWKFGLSAGQKGVGVTLGRSSQKIAGSELTERRWSIKSHMKKVKAQNSVVVDSKYSHTPSHNTGETIESEKLEPGPHSIFASPTEDGRTLRISIKTFWSSINSLASSNSGSSSWHRFREMFPVNDRSSRPFLFANFWHELSFDLDLSKIKAEKSSGDASRLEGDMVEGSRTHQDGPHPQFSSANVEVKQWADKAVQFTIPLKRAVIKALADGREDIVRVESQ